MAANHTGYTYDILPNGSSSDDLANNIFVHQTSPAWVLTFLRWKVRDTLRTTPTDTQTYQTIANQPLVVENDCLQLTVSDSKSVLTPSMSATLVVTDVNYETELSPGDFVFVNILNWEADARRVANNARDQKPINGIDDGFKGFFKVQSVRKILMSDPQSGTKYYSIQITGFAFTEFNNCIYFNPYLIDKSDQNTLLFANQIGIDWANLQTEKGLTKVQSVMQYLINSFIGVGLDDLGRKTNSAAPVTPNVHFFMPQGVGKLLGLSHLESAKDAYNYMFGIQQYSANSNSTLSQGMNPSGLPQNATAQGTGRFIFLPDPVEGDTVTKPEYWNQIKAWSILNQFTNAPLNELYTCFRVAPSGSVMPTLVFRQIPFTTDNFQNGSYKVTKFMSVPRWNIHPSLAFDFNLGKDETLRMNFVQYYGRSVSGPAGFDISDETAQQNYVYDIDDVRRNGLRPYVVTSEFDRLPQAPYSANGFRSPGWARIMGDGLIGGHLKFSGTINYAGIPEPIAVGDNLQFDKTVYHIEGLSHTAYQQPDGKKSFRTSVTLSSGVSIQSGDQVVYDEMNLGSGYAKRKNDYDSTQILPGVSEAQDTYYRTDSPEPPPIATPDSFTQPNTSTGINKFKRTP